MISDADTDGGLTKNGPGNLILNGTSSGSFSDFNGPIQVNAGNLYVNTALMGGGNITVESGAGLGGNSIAITAPTVLIKTGGALSPGSIANPGTLPLNNLVMQPNVTMNVRIGTNPAAISDKVAVGGNLTFGATTVYVNPYQGSISAGTYTFMTYTKSAGVRRRLDARMDRSLQP